MRGSIFFKLFAASTLLIAVTTISMDLLVRNTWRNSLHNEIVESLTQKTQLLANQVNDSPEAALKKLAATASAAAGARVTIIAYSGKVLADSDAQPEGMDNHATRPEFHEALGRRRIGVSIRHSRTLNIDFLYVAAPCYQGAVRLAYPLSEVQKIDALIRARLFTASLLALVIAGVAAAYLNHKVSQRMLKVAGFGERIAAGDLSARIEDEGDRSADEIGKLGVSLNRTADNLRKTILALEERGSELESLLNSMQDAVVAVGEKSHVKWANGAMKRLVGRDIATATPLIDLVRDPDVLGIAGRCVHSKSSCRTRAHLSGRIFDVTAASMPGGAVVVFHDVTDIERVEKTRRDFIANVSHELRTPLTSIQGYTETLLDNGIRKPEAKEFLSVILKNATRMSRLTEDLLTLASVESGETKLRLGRIATSELLADAVVVAEERHMTVRTECMSQYEVMCDRDAVHQVFVNLIENAHKYAKDSKEIVVKAADAGGTVEFSVADSGPGIASEHLPRLFERFYRVDKARSLESGGTGLGLAIVKHIVLAHGGTVRVESELNRGASFFFALPAAAPELVSPAPKI